MPTVERVVSIVSVRISRVAPLHPFSLKTVRFAPNIGEIGIGLDQGMVADVSLVTQL